PVPALSLAGQPRTAVAVEYVDALSPGVTWSILSNINLTSPSQFLFDNSTVLPQQRFYRARNADTNNQPGLRLSMAQGVTVTGAADQTLRLDYIHPIGPTDAWTTLTTVTLSNGPQCYF